MLLSDLQKWYYSAPGNWLFELEKDQLSKWVPLVQGSTVLQVGGLPNMFPDLNKHASHEYYFLGDQFDQEIDIVSAYDELPIRPNSINLAIIMHVLEFMDHPTILLKEIYDSITPNGKLLLFCFNPWSLWGIQKLFVKQDFPWRGKFRSPARLQQWLSIIGYNNVKDKTLGFRAPCIKKPLNRLTLFMEALGQITIPMLGAVNVFLVEKRVYGSVKDARYAWQKRKVPNNRIAEPTTRVVNE